MRGWIRHSFLLRPLIVALFLTLLSLLYFKVVYDPGDAAASPAKIRSQKWQPRHQLVAEEFVSSGGDLVPRHHFSSYDEYIQLQLRKTTNAKLRKIWSSKDWRRKVDVFGSIFRRLIGRGLLRPGSRALCIGARVGQEVLALRENGVVDATGIDLVPASPLVIRGDIHNHPFPNDTFDFEFSNVFDHALLPSRFVSEIERTLKPGGIAVIHAIIRTRGDNFSANQLRSLDPLVALFERSQVVEVRSVDAFGLDTELVMRKNLPIGPSTCRPKITRHTMRHAEPLIAQEPVKPWITLKRNVAKIQYLPRLMDTSDYHARARHVYVDVGARTYGSSIGGWFRKAYPTQGRNFTVYAVEADAAFHAGYAKRRDVTLLPYAAWTRNETLLFGAAGDDNMGRIQSATGVPQGTATRVQGFDFAAWLAATVAPSDYVVMKMDVEGTEFELLPRLIETGSICLVDELFLECHYNRWQKCCPGERSSKYSHTYTQCLALFQSLRSSGVLAHQWW